MTIGTILLIIIVLMLIGSVPHYGYSRGWGYGPSGIIGVLLVILIIMLIVGAI